MSLCDDGHPEVCYAGRDCPVCEKLKEIEELEYTIKAKSDEIDALKDAKENP